MLKKIALTMTAAVVAAAAAVSVNGSAAWAGLDNRVLQSKMDYRLVIEVRGWSDQPGMTLDAAWENTTYLSSVSAGTDQQWSIPTRGTGYIKNTSSHLCIETDGLTGDAVYQWTCDGSAYQQWRFDEFSVWDWDIWNYVTYDRIVNPISGLALNIRGGDSTPGTGIIGWPVDTNNDNEAWYITR
jgi:hypothetical protein